MPFGLTSAPTTCQTLMNNVMREFLDDFVLVYLDDIMTYSRIEEHLCHVQLVLQNLGDANLYMRPTSASLPTSTTFMGFSITHASISVDPKKNDVILNWSPPTTITKVPCLSRLHGLLPLVRPQLCYNNRHPHCPHLVHCALPSHTTPGGTRYLPYPPDSTHHHPRASPSPHRTKF